LCEPLLPLLWLANCHPHFACALQLIRQKLKKCYKESGVNFQQNCRELAQVRRLVAARSLNRHGAAKAQQRLTLCAVFNTCRCSISLEPAPQLGRWCA